MIGPVIGRNLVTGTDRQASASDGTPFDPSTDLWSFRTRSGHVNLNFSGLRGIAEDQLVDASKMAFRVLVQTRNLISVRACYSQFKLLVELTRQLKDRSVPELDAEDIASWCARGNAAYLGQLRPLLQTWQTLRLPGILTEAQDFAAQIKVPSSSDKDVVRSWDPDAGAYRPSEDSALKAALDSAFNEGVVELYDYALARTFRGLGMRPAQLAAMKCCDLRSVGDRSEIRIPLLKKRGVPERGEFMPWKPITQWLADILHLHINGSILPYLADNADVSLCALFPPRGRRIEAARNLEGHTNRDGLGKRLTKMFEQLNVISPVTGQKIPVTPTRERHTVLTGLAMQGCTPTEIAANAGHSDPTSCLAYIDASIQHFQRMERLVGEAFIPLADRFLGKVIREHDDQRAHDDPDSVVRGRDLTGVGSCADGGCGAIAAGVAPLACYECRKFRAWADAPHEYILGQLIAEQRVLIEAGHPDVAETKTSTIVAITDLLEAIRVREVANG